MYNGKTIAEAMQSRAERLLEVRDEAASLAKQMALMELEYGQDFVNEFNAMSLELTKAASPGQFPRHLKVSIANDMPETQEVAHAF